MHEYIGAAFSALAGSAVSGFLAKAIFHKTLKDLEGALERSYELTRQLSVALTRIEALEDLVPIIQEHDRAIAGLTRSYNGKNARLRNTDS